MTRLFPSKNYYAVPVPVDANGFDIYSSKNGDQYLTFYEGNPSFESIRTIDLPPGNYTILFASISATEQEAARVVDKFWSGWFTNYRNYEEVPGVDFHWKATESLASLLRSLGLVEENYLIIEKIEG